MKQQMTVWLHYVESESWRIIPRKALEYQWSFLSGKAIEYQWSFITDKATEHQ